MLLAADGHGFIKDGMGEGSPAAEDACSWVERVVERAALLLLSQAVGKDWMRLKGVGGKSSVVCGAEVRTSV